MWHRHSCLCHIRLLRTAPPFLRIPSAKRSRMLPVQQKPEPPRKRRGARLFAIWAVALAVIVFDTIMARALRPLHFPVGIFSFTTFLASLLLIALTLYGFAVFVRWT